MASGVAALIGLATSVFAARLLLPEGRGLLATVIFWPAFIVAIGMFSIPGAITYHAAADWTFPAPQRLTATVLWLL